MVLTLFSGVHWQASFQVPCLQRVVPRGGDRLFPVRRNRHARENLTAAFRGEKRGSGISPSAGLPKTLRRAKARHPRAADPVRHGYPGGRAEFPHVYVSTVTPSTLALFQTPIADDMRVADAIHQVDRALRTFVLRARSARAACVAVLCTQSSSQKPEATTRNRNTGLNRQAHNAETAPGIRNAMARECTADLPAHSYNWEAPPP
jgi:hypothetical protein